MWQIKCHFNGGFPIYRGFPRSSFSSSGSTCSKSSSSPLEDDVSPSTTPGRSPSLRNVLILSAIASWSLRKTQIERILIYTALGWELFKSFLFGRKNTVQSTDLYLFINNEISISVILLYILFKISGCFYKIRCWHCQDYQKKQTNTCKFKQTSMQHIFVRKKQNYLLLP